MQKKKIFIISIGIISISLILIILSNNVFSNNNNIITSNNKKVYSSSLAMMLETDAGSGEYKESTNTSWADAIANGYTYNAELSRCENGSVLTWNDSDNTISFSGTKSDKCYIYFDIKPLETLSDHIISLYTEDGENGLYYHDGTGTYGTYEAGDYSYRYSGADPDNYVYFGDDCSNTDNLYRIIGVFGDRVKLIKYDYAISDALGTDGAYYGTGSPNSSYYKGSLSTVYWYYWNNSTSTNTWSESDLNTVNLNTNFWAWLGSTWQAYIDDTTWQVGGNTYENIIEVTNAKTNYDNEITSTASSVTYSAKIGLMYVSEYRYAADPTQADAWSAVQALDYDNSTVTANNWMYMGDYDWTITRRSDTTSYAFPVDISGIVLYDGVDYNNYSIRPSFSLKSSVELAGGTGTASDPYRITD